MNPRTASACAGEGSAGGADDDDGAADADEGCGGADGAGIATGSGTTIVARASASTDGTWWAVPARPDCVAGVAADGFGAAAAAEAKSLPAWTTWRPPLRKSNAVVVVVVVVQNGLAKRRVGRAAVAVSAAAVAAS